MNAKHKKSVIGPVFFLFVIFLLIVSALAYGGYRRYLVNRAALMRDIEALASFDPEAEAKEIAEEKKWTWPILETPVAQEKADELAKKAVADVVGEKFPAKSLSAGLVDIMRKYSMAKAGETITVKLKASNEVVTGEFRRNEDSANTGILAVLAVNGVERKLPLRIIMDEYAYMFTPAASEAEQRIRIDEFKKTFEKNRDEYFAKMKDELLPKTYESIGYTCDDEGNWISKKACVLNLVDVRQKKFEKSLRQKLKDLAGRHAFLWVIPIEIDHEKIVMGKLPAASQQSTSSEK